MNLNFNVMNPSQWRMGIEILLLSAIIVCSPVVSKPKIQNTVTQERNQPRLKSLLTPLRSHKVFISDHFNFREILDTRSEKVESKDLLESLDQHCVRGTPLGLL